MISTRDFDPDSYNEYCYIEHNDHLVVDVEDSRASPLIHIEDEPCTNLLREEMSKEIKNWRQERNGEGTIPLGRE